MIRLSRAAWARLVGRFDSLQFARLAQTHLLSSAGDALVAVALAGSVFFSEDPNTARTKVALSLALTMAPFAIVAPFIGPLIDQVRSGRRIVLVVACVLRAVLSLMMATVLDSALLYPFAFLSLVLSKTHAVTKSATVPEIVRDEQLLVKANSALAVCAVLAGLVFGGVGYGFASVVGDAWVLRIAALVFVVGAALAFDVGSSVKPQTHVSPKLSRSLLRESGVLTAAAVMSVLRGAVGFLTFLIAFDLRRSGAATIWFGVAVTSGLIGSSVGNLIGPTFRKHVREESMLIGGSAAVVLTALALLLNPGRLSNAVLAFVLGACTSIGKLGFDSLLQRDISAAIRARVFSLLEAAFQFVWVIGALLPVVIVISNDVGYVLIATAAATAATWFGLSLRQRRRNVVAR